MNSRRLAAVAIAAVAAAVVAAPALAKDGVEATIETPIPLDPSPGEEIDVAWTLSFVDDGKWRPFGASGVFVRLVSPSGGDATTAFASGDGGRTGAYGATVVVPEGGIGRIVVGLRGTASGPTGSRTSDVYFPVTNDPLQAATVASPRATTPSVWPTAGAAAALGLCGLVIALWQRRRLRGALGRVGGLGAR